MPPSGSFPVGPWHPGYEYEDFLPNHGYPYGGSVEWDTRKNPSQWYQCDGGSWSGTCETTGTGFFDGIGGIPDKPAFGTASFEIMDSITYYEQDARIPWDDLHEQPSEVIGFTVEGGYTYIDGGRCEAINRLDVRDNWSSSGEESAFWDWFYSAVDPTLDGYMRAHVWGYIEQGYGRHFTVGKPSSYVFGVGAGPYGTLGYFPTDIYTTVSGTTFDTPHNPGADWEDGPFIDIPLHEPTVTEEHSRPVLVTAVKISDLPFPYQMLPTNSGQVNSSVSLNNGWREFWYPQWWATSSARGYQWIGATPGLVGIAIPRRQIGRTDGLLGAPRQVGSASMRQTGKVW